MPKTARNEITRAAFASGTVLRHVNLARGYCGGEHHTELLIRKLSARISRHRRSGRFLVGQAGVMAGSSLELYNKVEPWQWRQGRVQ